MAPRDCCCGLMRYRSACLLGSLPLLAWQVTVLNTELNVASKSEPSESRGMTLLIGTSLLQMPLHILLLVGTLTEWRAALTLWLYCTPWTALLRCIHVLLCFHGGTSWDLVRLFAQVAALLWAVWHLTYQYVRFLVERGRGRAGRRGDALLRAEEAAPDAPCWERSLALWRLLAALDRLNNAGLQIVTGLWPWQKRRQYRH